jgi:hypothetical protein
MRPAADATSTAAGRVRRAHGGRGEQRLRLGGDREPIVLEVKPDWRTSATAVGSIVSVLLVAAGLFYTNDANRQQQEVAIQQEHVAIQGQVAERFSTAIDQIGQEGDEKLSIRLGGIYALDRLMHDSPADEPTVTEVLCAFVRTHAARPSKVPSKIPPSPPDVRAAITVLGRRPNPKNAVLDLSSTLLGLSDADLTGANLSLADLTGANLSLADLTNADLSLAHLRDADLSYARLYGANLNGANMNGADLHGAHVDFANLLSAHLNGANMNRAGLHDADLRGADLRGADLRGADLRGADLRGAFELTSDQLAGAIVDDSTALPPGVVRPSPSPSR